jgi:hypothetical protein
MKIMTRPEFDSAIQTFKAACAFNFHLNTRWPQASAEQLAAAQKDYDEKLAAITDVTVVDVVPFGKEHIAVGDCADAECICQNPKA